MRTPPRSEQGGVERGTDPRGCSSSNPLLTAVNLSQIPSPTGDVDLSTPASNRLEWQHIQRRIQQGKHFFLPTYSMPTAYMRTTRRTRRTLYNDAHITRYNIYMTCIYQSIHQTNQRKHYVIPSTPHSIPPTDKPLSYDSDCALNPS